MKKRPLQNRRNPASSKDAIKVLLIDGEHHLADSVARRLSEEGYTVDLAYDGEEGAALALTKRYQVILLELLLPRKDGMHLLKEIRRHKVESMVMVVTAKSLVEDRVEGLRAGADDYLIKPFALSELLARVEALLRRRSVKHSAILRVGDVELDTATRTVRRANKTVQLTTKEYLLLEILMRNKHRVVTRKEIAERVWGLSFDPGTNLVDVYVNYLRKAIDRGFSKRFIHTIRGSGFILKEE